MDVDPDDVVEDVSDLAICLRVALLLGHPVHVPPPMTVDALRMLLDCPRAYCQHRWVRVDLKFFGGQNCVEPVETAKHLLSIRRKLAVLTAYCLADSEARQESPRPDQS